LNIFEKKTTLTEYFNSKQFYVLLGRIAEKKVVRIFLLKQMFPERYRISIKKIKIRKLKVVNNSRGRGGYQKLRVNFFISSSILDLRFVFQ
jgi:hypothetical protein